MSQINIENLLKLNPVEPNVFPAQNTPDYKSSQYSGGQVRIGKVGQQVGPTGDAAMFKTLSEIASGTAQAINTFADIGSRVDQERIKKAKLYFDELDTDSSLEPEQKEERLNQYLKEVSTPILGTSWIKELNTAVYKNWTSEDSRNKYEEDRWNKEYQEWKNLPKNQNRIETDELLQEFNNYYQYNYPLAKNNNWFLKTKGKVDSSINLKLATQNSRNLQASLDIYYDFPNSEVFTAYNNSTDPKYRENIEATYSTFFNVMGLTKDAENAENIQTILMKDAEEKFQEKFSTLDEAVQPEFYDQLRSLTFKKAQELFNLKQSDNARQVQTQAATNIAIVQSNFSSDKNIPKLLDGTFENIGNLTPLQRNSQVYGLFPLMWKELNSGTSSLDFQKLPIDKQIKKIEEVFDIWYQKNNLIFADITGITDIETFKNVGKNYILSDDNLGGKFVNTQISNFTNYARQLKDQNLISASSVIQSNLEKFRTNLSTTLGITLEELQSLSYTQVEAGPVLSINNAVSTWFESLSRESQQNLIDRGFTVDNFSKLETLRTMYVDLETSSVKSVEKITGKDSESTNPLMKKTDNELKSALLMDSGIRSSSFSIDLNKADEQQIRLLQTKRDMEKRFETFLQSKLKTISGLSPDFGLFTESDGSLSVDSLSPQSILSKLTVDNTGSLDTEGKKVFLRLQFAAMEMAQIEPSDPSQNSFKTEVKTLLTQIGSLGFNNVIQTNPSKIYSVVAMLEGLSAGDPNFSNSQLFTGADSEGLKATVGLLKAANKLGGGIIDLTPGDIGDNDYKTGFKTINGVRTPLSQEEKDAYNEHPTRRIINAWSIFMDSFATPIAEKGGGQINPIIQTGSQVRLTNIRDEISAIILAYSGSGPTIYRENKAATALIKRLQFPGKGTESDKIKETADVFWRLTGSVFPMLGEKKEVKVRIPTNDGMINKSWNELTEDQQIGVYIAALAEVDRDSFSGLLGGWLRNSNNPATKDIYTLDMFEYTFDFINRDLLKPTVIQNGQVTPPKYRTQTYDRTSTGLVLTPELVNDGVKISRKDLFDQAKALAFTKYTVGQETKSTPWYQEGDFKDIFIPGETKINRLLLGASTSEDGFILSSYLSTEMKENTYPYYEWWAKTLGKTPVSKEVYTNEIKSRLQPKGKEIQYTDTLPIIGGPITREYTLETDHYPPLFEVISALHQLDLTDSSFKINVDSTGQTYFDIGVKSYLVEDKPPIAPKTEFTNKSEVEESSIVFRRHLLKLERERAIKRVTYATKKEYPLYTAPIVSETNPQRIVTNMDRALVDYWKQAFNSPLDPWTFMQKVPFDTFYEKRIYPNGKPGEKVWEESIQPAIDLVRGIWKPIVEDINKLNETKFKTQFERNRARQELLKKIDKQMKEGI
jgi:hypothetical protein